MAHSRLARFTAYVLIVSMLAGCMHLDKNLHYLGDADLQYYKNHAAAIEYPSVDTTTPQEVTASEEPHTLRNRSDDQPWDMTLSEALHTALANNRIIRTRGQFQGQTAVDNLAASVYDPAIQETGVLFGGRGIEAALSDFDAQFTTSMIWGRDEQVQNNAFIAGGLLPGNTLKEESGVFNSSLQKAFGYGGSLNLANDWIYSGRNNPGQLFKSAFMGNVRAEYRQPLWAGAGTEFTRIAGPLNPNFRGITGVSQGVVIARINNDISLADFETNVQNMVKDVEDLYWELYLSYQVYRTAVVARNSALKTWRDAEATDRAGGIEGFDKSDVPQARDQYFARKADAETALNDIYARETELRRIIGLPVNDGRVIRPVDEPTKAPFLPDWRTCLSEALTLQPGLRKQKWQIKSLELQHLAAQSLTKPQLDFVSAYKINGFGDHLFGLEDDDGVTAQGLHSAYETITQGDQTGWNLGFVFSMPLGFRSARAQVRNYELRLLKSREVLATMELDTAHSVATAFQGLAAFHATAESNLNRQIAARERVDILEKQRLGGVLKADLVLRAQASLAEAERAYYTSLVRYNQAIIDLHFRKGTILSHDGIYLAEDEWTSEAYREAYRRAYARSHAFNADAVLDTQPGEFVLPNGGSTEVLLNAPPAADGPEPAPQPVPPAPAADDDVPSPGDVPTGATTLPKASASAGASRTSKPVLPLEPGSTSESLKRRGSRAPDLSRLDAGPFQDGLDRFLPAAGMFGATQR